MTAPFAPQHRWVPASAAFVGCIHPIQPMCIMKRAIYAVVALCVLWPASQAGAQDGAFCRGFAEGWKTLKGELSLVPICPIAPITPIGSKGWREQYRRCAIAAREGRLLRRLSGRLENREGRAIDRPDLSYSSHHTDW
jgi:hypothetical protein